MKKQVIWAILVALVLLGLGWFVVAKKGGEKPTDLLDTTQPATTSITKIDEHLTIKETLREVNFCGKTYKVKQVIIDGVDVTLRVAELVKKPENSKMKVYADNICETVTFNPQEELEIRAQMFEYEAGERYGVSTGIFQVAVNTKTYDIYEIGGFDGKLNGPIGKLK